MTVTAAQITKAKEHLTNVDAAARVADKLKIPFYLLCAVLTKETGGKNIFGHDSGGAMYGEGEVTEAKYRLFRQLIDSGMRSNGVGPMQITYKGFFPIMEGRGIRPWVPYDNIGFGAELIKDYYNDARDDGLSVTEAIRRAGTKYNGASAYGDSLVAVANTWRERVGTEDTVNPGERIPFRGGLTCSCVVASLPWVEFELALRGLPSPINIFQLGYRTDVSASAGTHDRGGCVDQDGTPTAAEIDVWRLWGWTMQDRSPFFAQNHAHGWPYKCPHLSLAAEQQEDDWDNKDAGLRGAAQVQGRWPVKPWNIALKERKMAVIDEVAKAVVEAMKNDERLKLEFADAFLDRRSIKNNYRDNSAEPDGKISTELALGHLGNTKIRVDEILNIVKDIQADLTAP